VPEFSSGDGSWTEDQPADNGYRFGKNLESFTSDFELVRGPIRRWKGNGPEVGSGLNEFDFRFSVGVFVAKSDAAGLFLCGFGIFDNDDLADCNWKIQIDEGSMGADHDGVRAFRDVDIIRAAGDDLDGNAEKDALAAAPIGHGSKIRRERV
jgi:hypothetical protein